MGGLIIGHEVARALDRPFLFTERIADGSMALRRGFAVAAGQQVVVVEDVVTTGRSTREVITLLGDAGAEVAGVCSLVNRTGRGAPFGTVPYHALIHVSFPTWKPEECPMCREDQPFDRPGSRPVA